MSNKRWEHQAVHLVHHAMHTETGKNAVKAATTALVAVAPAALAATGAAASAVALPAVAIAAVGYGLYRLLK